MSRFLACLLVFAFLGCGPSLPKGADLTAKGDALWLIDQAGSGMSSPWQSRGKPKVEGNTVTFIDATNGKTVILSGRFTITQADNAPAPVDLPREDEDDLTPPAFKRPKMKP